MDVIVKQCHQSIKNEIPKPPRLRVVTFTRWDSVLMPAVETLGREEGHVWLSAGYWLLEAAVYNTPNIARDWQGPDLNYSGKYPSRVPCHHLS